LTLQSAFLEGVKNMRSKWIALAALAALLSACAASPTQVGSKEPQPWNGGIWNSVLGYVGPNNVMVTN
jgi:starvation-inducible outer membrane lipoprotein